MQDTEKAVKKNKGIIVTTIIVLVATGVGFFGGVQYQKSQKVKTPSGFQGGLQNGSGRTTEIGKNGTGGMARNGNQPVSGEITSIDDTGITVKTADGGSKIIIFSSSTKVNKTTEGLKSDLTKGATVMVIGTTGTDGTVTAQTVSVGNVAQGMPSGAQPPQGN
jgi:hypothetical protein